jgi:hypothetical protein
LGGVGGFAAQLIGFQDEDLSSENSYYGELVVFVFEYKAGVDPAVRCSGHPCHV